MRAICRPMTAGSAVRDFSFRKQYDNEGSSVSMTYGLICYAPLGARLSVYTVNRWFAPPANVLASQHTREFLSRVPALTVPISPTSYGRGGGVGRGLGVGLGLGGTVTVAVAVGVAVAVAVAVAVGVNVAVAVAVGVAVGEPQGPPLTITACDRKWPSPEGASGV